MSATPATPSHTSNTVTTVAKHVPYSGPKDLDNEFSAMLAIYTEKEGEGNWMKREKSLLRIRGLVTAGAGGDPHFQVNLKRIVPAISESMQSLRTQLALQACLLVGDLAEGMKNDFASYAEAFSAVFLKLFAQTKKILANQASETMLVIISSAEVPKLIPSFCATLGDKNKDVRVKGSEVVKAVLEKWSSETLFKGEQPLEKAVRLGLVDATPAVRENSRVSFWRYASLFPSRAPIMLSAVDPNTLKHLEKSRPKDLAITTDFGSPSLSETSSPVSPKPLTPINQAGSGVLFDSEELEEQDKSPAKTSQSPTQATPVERPRVFAFKREEETPIAPGSQKSATSKNAAFVINFDDIDAADDGFLQPTPIKPTGASQTSRAKKETAGMATPLAKTPEAVAVNDRSTSDDGLASSTSSSWHKAEADEEPWVEVTHEKETTLFEKQPSTPQKGLSLQTETPKKQAVSENKENMGGHTNLTVTPQKDGFLTPSILRNRDQPRTPSTASPNYDWDRNLPLLLTQLEGGSPKEDLFRKLARLSKGNLERVWRVNFDVILRLCAEFLARQESGDSLQQEKCLEFVKEMLVHQKDYFESRASDVLRLLMSVELQAGAALKCIAQDALSVLATNLPLEEVYTSLFDTLAEDPTLGEEEQRLLFPLLPKVLARFSSAKTGLLPAALPSLAPFLLSVFQHKSSHIRRSVVESIIEIRLATTEQTFLAHFGSLSLQQRKLVDMCMKRHPLVAGKSAPMEEEE